MTRAGLIESNYSCQGLQRQSLPSTKQKELSLRRTTKQKHVCVCSNRLDNCLRSCSFLWGRTGRESETEIQSHREGRRSHNGMRQSITQEVRETERLHLFANQLWLVCSDSLNGIFVAVCDQFDRNKNNKPTFGGASVPNSSQWHHQGVAPTSENPSLQRAAVAFWLFKRVAG